MIDYMLKLTDYGSFVYFSAAVAVWLSIHILHAAINVEFHFENGPFDDDLTPAQLQNALEKIRLDVEQHDKRVGRTCDNASSYFTTVAKANLMDIGTLC